MPNIQCTAGAQEVNAAWRWTLLNYERRKMTLKVPQQLCSFAMQSIIFLFFILDLLPRPSQAHYLHCLTWLILLTDFPIRR
jgi:hypothetical protein